MEHSIKKKQRTSKSQKEIPTSSEPLPTLPLEIITHLFSFLPLPNLLALYKSIPFAIIDEAIREATLCTEISLRLSSNYDDIYEQLEIYSFNAFRVPQLLPRALQVPRSRPPVSHFPLRCTGFDVRAHFLWFAPYTGKNAFSFILKSTDIPLYTSDPRNSILNFILEMPLLNDYKLNLKRTISETFMAQWLKYQTSIPDGKDFTLWNRDYIIQGYMAYVPYSKANATAITTFDESLRQSSPPITSNSSDIEPPTDKIIEAFERQDGSWPRAQPRHIHLADVRPRTFLFIDRVGITLSLLANLQRRPCQDPLGILTIFPQRLAFVRELFWKMRLPIWEVVKLLYKSMEEGQKGNREEVWIFGILKKEELIWMRDKKELENMVKRLNTLYRKRKRV